MTSYIGDEGEFFAITKILAGSTFRLGLHSHTDAELAALGEKATEADLKKVTNVVPALAAGGVAAGFSVSGAEALIAGNDFTIPGGVNEGDPATHPQVEFVAGAGGATSPDGAVAGGYYLIDQATGDLYTRASHPEVASSGTRKSMAQDAIYRVNPQLGTE